MNIVLEKIKKIILSYDFFWQMNSHQKDENLKRYYTDLRNQYVGRPSISFNTLLHEKKKQYSIKFEKKEKYNILFYYDPSGWLKVHLEPTFTEMGSFDVLTYVDSDHAIIVDRKENGKKLLAHLKIKSDYDFIFIGGARGHIAHEFLQEAMQIYHIPIINFQFDDKQIFSKQIKGVEVGSLEAARGSLLTFTNAKYSIDWYLKENCPVVYLPEGSLPSIYYPDNSVNKDIDVAFFGQKYGQRGKLIDHLQMAGINVKGFGPGWESGFLTYDDQRRMIQRSKIIISHEGIGYSNWPAHIKGKTFDFTMSGACLLTSYCSELPDWFTLNKEILCYYNFDDAIDIIQYYLNNEAERNAIAKAGYNRSINQHTWRHRFETILSIIESNPV